MKFYSMALFFANCIQEKGEESDSVALYSDLHKLFRKYLVDEPFQLSELTGDQIASGQKSEPLAEIIRLRDVFLKAWAHCKPNSEQGQLSV